MPAAGYTLATIRTAIWRALQDETGAYYTATAVKAAVNNRLSDFCLRAQCRRYTWRKNIVADQVIYDLTDLSPRAIDIQDVAMPQSAGATDEYSLQKVSMEWLNANAPQWRTADSSWPRQYSRWTEGFDGLILYPPAASSQSASVRDGTLYATLGSGGLINLVGIGTAQATAAVGGIVAIQFLVGSMRLDGIAGSTDLDDDADTLEAAGVPPQYQQAIFDGAMSELCRMDVPIAQAQKADQYEAAYEAMVAKASRLVKAGFQSKPAETVRGSNF